MTRTLLVALALLALSTPTRAAELDLERWLAEPGVQLVAVDFYAEWCEPCMAAVPRWEALRKRYQRDGLKLVVVNHDPKKPGCPRLSWRPDENICDLKGEIGTAFGFPSLPAAYLWSWQGNLLVDGNLLVAGKHIEAVESAIRRYLKETPKVLVEAVDEKGRKDAKLTRLFEAKLNDAGKLEVVSDAATRKKLAKIRRESRDASKRDIDQCPLGQEVAANSLLAVERMDDQLSVRLVNAVTGCQQGVFAPWDARKPDKSVAAAVHRLLGALVRKTPQMPGGHVAPRAPRSKPRRVTVRKVDGGADEWAPEDHGTIAVEFVSKPAGAQVTLDGEVVCKRAPCSREVSPGRHRVAMTLERYATRERTVTLEAGQNVSWSLEPTFGTLAVRSEPSGVAVTIDGKAHGKTPLEGLVLPEGEHTVVVEDTCHSPATRIVDLPRGKSHALDIPLKSRPAGLKVSAVDAKGNALEADVYVDGQKLGQTPNTWKVSVCASKLTVRHPTHGERSGPLKLEAQKTARMDVTLSDVEKAPPPRAKPPAPKQATKQAPKSVTFSGWSLVGYCDGSSYDPKWGVGPVYGCSRGDSLGAVVAPFFYGGAKGDAVGLVVGTGVTVGKNLVGAQVSPINILDGWGTFFQAGLYNDVGEGFLGAQVGAVNLVGRDFLGGQAGAVNYARNFGGVQVGALNVIDKDIVGIQLGGVNLVGGVFIGAQAGVWNDAQYFGGIQAGAVNLVDDELFGIQLGGFNWVGDELVFGAQLGVVNLVEESEGGMQVGVFNYMDRITGFGFQIGLVNVVDRNLYGVQVGGLNMLLDGAFEGFQLGGLMVNGSNGFSLPVWAVLTLGL